MKILDPGHCYLLDVFDGSGVSSLTFMKREGELYPGNVGHYPGTNLQEVVRVLISRMRYLNNQVPCDENEQNILWLQSILWALEKRAARRHKRKLRQPLAVPIEEEITCPICGHMQCEHMNA